eukprot:jgi/Hompol1/5391/HPOL_004374-RA
MFSQALIVMGDLEIEQVQLKFLQQAIQHLAEAEQYFGKTGSRRMLEACFTLQVLVFEAIGQVDDRDRVCSKLRQLSESH